MSATMKFSGGMGAPNNRRSKANCPAWVMASENGPCNNRSGVVATSGVPAAK